MEVLLVKDYDDKIGSFDVYLSKSMSYNAF